MTHFSQIEDHALRVYAGMIRALDRSVGRIEQALEDNGLSENTLIVFTSDNGGAGYIGLPNINKPYRGWKLDHFEGGIHVPYMAKWPARITAGTCGVRPGPSLRPVPDLRRRSGCPGAHGSQAGRGRPAALRAGRGDGVPHQTLFWREGYQQTVLHDGWKLIRADQPDKPAGTGQRKWLFNLADGPDGAA